MQLMMYLENDLIEAVTLERSQIPKPGYLGNIKRSLKEKHALAITASGIAPDFLVVASTRKANDPPEK